MPRFTCLPIALAATLCALALIQPGGAGAARPTIVGAAFTAGRGSLVRLDPTSLERVGAPIASFAAPWSAVRSPDGRRIALASGAGPIRIVEIASGRILRTIPAGPATLTPSLFGRARLIAIAGSTRSSIVVIDPRSGRVLHRHALGGRLLEGAPSGGRLVLLVAPATGLGTARVIVVSGDGRLRSVALPQITAGTRLPVSADGSARDESPGLAVDPSGRRAAVVDGEGRIAVVDLRTLAVAVHRVASRTLASARKELTGWGRSAAWLSPGVLAVSGVDYTGRMRPAGLRLIRTGSWTSRLVDASASELEVAHDNAIVVGDRTGLRAYGADGKLRYSRSGSGWIGGLESVGGLLYLSGCNSFCYRVVDPATGRVLASPNLSRQTVLVP